MQSFLENYDYNYKIFPTFAIKYRLIVVTRRCIEAEM